MQRRVLVIVVTVVGIVVTPTAISVVVVATVNTIVIVRLTTSNTQPSVAFSTVKESIRTKRERSPLLGFMLSNISSLSLLSIKMS